MWKMFRQLVVDGDSHDPRNEEVTSEQASKQRPSTSENIPEPCHFLRLPTEIRLQIYTYTSLVGQTIEVLNLPIRQTPQGAQCHRTYSTDPTDHALVYRIETRSHARAPASGLMAQIRASSLPAKQRRFFSIHGLFSLTSVCRQIRAETHLLVYESNAFAFSGGNYNYARAIRAFTQSLTERELSAIRTICWPLLGALSFQRSLRGVESGEPDRACVEEIRAPTGLRRVVLRFGAVDLNVRIEYSDAEVAELERLVEEAGGEIYATERRFRRMLAVRGMKMLLAKEEVEVECEKMPRLWN